jgi:hypothetical protein
VQRPYPRRGTQGLSTIPNPAGTSHCATPSKVRSLSTLTRPYHPSHPLLTAAAFGPLGVRGFVPGNEVRVEGHPRAAHVVQRVPPLTASSPACFTRREIRGLFVRDSCSCLPFSVSPQGCPQSLRHKTGRAPGRFIFVRDEGAGGEGLDRLAPSFLPDVLAPPPEAYRRRVSLTS